MSFAAPLSSLQGVGPARSTAFEKRGLRTIQDLLLWAPMRYAAAPAQTDAPTPKSPTSVVVQVRSRRKGRFQSRRGGYLEARVDIEGQGTPLHLRFYNQPWLFDRIAVGDRLIISGELEARSPGHFVVDRFKKLSSEADREHFLKELIPSYSSIDGVPEGILRRLIDAARKLVLGVEDPLPLALRTQAKVASLDIALGAVHAPETEDEIAEGHARLLVDRFLARLIPVAMRAPEVERAPPIQVTEVVRKRIFARFPFPFTSGQLAAFEEILADLRREHPMRRLLQGDVGSGKTAVAIAAALAVIAAKKQVLYLAPTEPLALQQTRVVLSTLAQSRVRIEMLTASVSKSARAEILGALQRGEIHFLVATHAVLRERVTFADLGFVIVDEQHKFGVRARLAARDKGSVPHVLGMSATPIPRSLFLALLGGLDLSVLLERPMGRGTPPTQLASPHDALAETRATVLREERAFLVYPAIESEALPCVERDGRALTLPGAPLQGVPVVRLHGRQDIQTQRAALDDFVSGRASVLVATSMVEVGLDVPEATLMVVFAAERFGLAGLHQLRGRVGRGSLPGRCLLVPGPRATPEARERLSVLVRETDGFRIAEEDLLQRGPGEILGVRQAGQLDAFASTAFRDRELFERSVLVARELAKAPPEYYLTLAASETAVCLHPENAV